MELLTSTNFKVSIQPTRFIISLRLVFYPRSLRPAELPMILLINAISIKEGGSLVVLRNYVEQFSRLRPDMQMHLTLNTKVSGLREFQSPNVTIWTYPRVESFPS